MKFYHFHIQFILHCKYVISFDEYIWIIGKHQWKHFIWNFGQVIYKN